ncbi:serine protease snake-like, partial [Asbolus verrucosus]
VTHSKKRTRIKSLRNVYILECAEYLKIPGKFGHGIIGGSLAQNGEFPHMVALGYGDKHNITWLCGGTIISENYVLTAAHCTSNHQLGAVKVARIGSRNLKDDGIHIEIANIIRHPDYQKPSVYNDIALLELRDKIQFFRSVLPACLNTALNIKPETNQLVATGWGLLQFAGPPSDNLMKVNLTLYPHRQCRVVYNNVSKQRLAYGIDFSTQICAGGAPNEEKDTCQVMFPIKSWGDSGGPLAMKTGVLYTVVGVTSFGKACGLANIPTVYTRVSAYVPWIEKIVWPEYSKYVIEKVVQPILLITSPDIEKNNCGHKVVKLIVGGEPAGRREFPHMAAIGFEAENNPNDIKWICGGSIISEEYILTAGHCLISAELGPAKYAKVGITNLNDNSKRKQEIRISERIAHPDYRSTSHYNDIGLVKLERPAQMNSFSRPACLYPAKEITAEKAIATGWGKTSYAGVGSDDLLKVTLNFYSQENCNKSYRNQISRKLRRGIVGDTQVCAGSNEEKDTCQGDSGGPLQIYHINDDIKCMYDIVGVTSFGKACSASPGVYTRVSQFIQWIEDIAVIVILEDHFKYITKVMTSNAVIGYEEVSNDIKWLCGGTIISQQYILTAGHCLVSSQFGPAKYVRMGITNLNDRSTHKQEIRVTERIAHPEYRSSSHYNDIGLLKLQKPARMNSFSRPACLYTNNEITAEKAIATGWGNTAYAGTSSDDLLKVTLDFFTHENCNRSYKNQISRKLKRGIIDDIQICAGSLDDEEKDTCQGDSGGPLQIYHINDDIKCMYDIVGVTSFGKACSGSPG